jgi:hypothetical protein
VCDALKTVNGGSGILDVKRQLRLSCGQPKRLHLRIQGVPFVQVLRNRFGTCGIASHCECKRGFDVNGATCWSQFQALRHGFLCVCGVAERSFSESSIFQPYRRAFFALCTYGRLYRLHG